MSVGEVLAARRTCRSFTSDSLPSGLIDDLVDRARRTPTAGNCQGVEFLVLDDPGDVAAFWDTTLPRDRRSSFPWPGMLEVPALVLPFGLPECYLDRYREPDKAGSGLGDDAGDWSVPYWLTDAAFAAMAFQLLVVEAGLACCFFGLFGNEAAVRGRFDVPDTARAPGVVAVGYPDPEGDRPSGSAGRQRRPRDEVLHRGCW